MPAELKVRTAALQEEEMEEEEEEDWRRVQLVQQQLQWRRCSSVELVVPL